MRATALLTALSSLLAVTTFAADAAPCALTVQVVGLQSSNGKVGCWLYDAAHAKGYPTDATAAHALRWGAIAASRATVTFDGLAPGTYALACFHDENGNGKLDTNWLGIPKEGMVASNHAKGRMGPPKFDDAKFALAAPQLALQLKIKY